MESEGIIVIQGQGRVIGKALLAVDGGGARLLRQTGRDHLIIDPPTDILSQARPRLDHQVY